LLDSFEWYWDPDGGYTLEPARTHVWQPVEAIEEPPKLFRLKDQQQAPPPPPAKALAGPLVEDIGARANRRGDLVPYLVGKRFPKLGLLKEFCLVVNEASAMQFINRAGPLTVGGLSIGEDLQPTIDFAQRARVLLLAHQRADLRKIKELLKEPFRTALGPLVRGIWPEIFFDPASKRAKLRFTDADLKTILLFQVASAISGGHAIRICEHCGKPFQAGPGEKRRLDSDYCSPQCQTTHNNRKRTANGTPRGRSHSPTQPG